MIKHFFYLIGFVMLYPIGFIVVPLLILFNITAHTPWGNVDDSRGITLLEQDLKGFKLFKWLQIRNPMHNYCRALGVKELPENTICYLFKLPLKSKQYVYIGYRIAKYYDTDIYGWRGVFRCSLEPHLVKNLSFNASKRGK